MCSLGTDYLIENSVHTHHDIINHTTGIFIFQTSNFASEFKFHISQHIKITSLTRKLLSNKRHHCSKVSHQIKFPTQEIVVITQITFIRCFISVYIWTWLVYELIVCGSNDSSRNLSHSLWYGRLTCVWLFAIMNSVNSYLLQLSSLNVNVHFLYVTRLILACSQVCQAACVFCHTMFNSSARSHWC